MCKPGSACCGCGVSSSGLGMAVAVLGIVGAVSMAAALASTILTAALIIVFGAAAAVAVMLVVLLRRSRGVVTWPMRPARLPAAGRRAPLVPGHVLSAAGRPALGQPATRAAARPAIAGREPLAIEEPAPDYVRAGLPAGLSGPATRWLPARLPGSVSGGPAPEAVLASRACSDWAGLTAAEVTPDNDVPLDGQPADTHYV
jgi:hypothetical protein